jgi:uncharacterized membrane protein (GlpM family)
MGLLIKGLLGALVVVLIGVLAKSKNYYIAGLIPLFPTFALIAHYIVASERGIEALRPPSSSGCGQSFPILSICCRCGTSPASCACRWRWQAQWVLGLCAWLLILGWSRFH